MNKDKILSDEEFINTCICEHYGKIYDENDENCITFLNNLIKIGKYRELEKFYEDYLIEYQNEHKVYEEEIDELDYWDGRDGWSYYHDESICNK